MAGGVVHVNADTPHVAVQNFTASADWLAKFKKGFKIDIKELSDEEIVFDMVGIDASIANALRRILLAEVATMAIETVYIWNNSSIIKDEVLAHRLGLIPLQVDPRKFQSFPENEEAEATDENTIVFKLDVTCRKDPSHPDDLSKALHANVYSSDLEWVPQGSQQERFDVIRPVHEDILIAKLRPGQSIALEAHCRKGVGKDHAKFSPVSTASYRLMPKINLEDEIKGKDAEELVEKCPKDVFDIEDLGKKGKRAVVARPRDCTMCRECIREPEWQDRVKLTRHFDHFIFSVESVGMFRPEVLVKEALKVLIEKCEVAQRAVEEMSVMDTSE